MIGVTYSEEQLHLNTFTIFTRQWLTEGAKATLFVQHGYAEHSGRYKHVGEYFANHKYNVFMMDLPGHGQSSGIEGAPRTYIDSFETYITTINQFVDTMKTKMESKNIILPMFFMGHSMGGLLTSVLAGRKSEMKGFIASAPAYIIKNTGLNLFSWAIQGILKFNPYLTADMDSPSNIITNQEVAREYVTDPFNVCSKACAMTSLEMKSYGEVEKDRDLDIPFYLFHGSGDTLIDVKGARIKATHLNNPVSKYVEYPGANHVLLEEDNKFEMLDGVEKWVDSLIENK
ncbi:monoglyceride lipase, putative [Entamoeba invadens IP1]|uniref:monoglyceride lipase, putative n=1 Tax=Entamoeba invadens IP1 TaxID=370355 RepID=UPI0002C3D6F5|nr:monoglyceride lipase, putative [Entamoeba invadens IP1]ELP85314.1 monoglyceride lipase, putative [Entamoeba invadens IP1]|eukprot:XP_004184660.1 monoglyceride lipase, putative [Entamoeba invadens IP1]